MKTTRSRFGAGVVFFAGVLCTAAFAQQTTLQGSALGSTGGVMQGGQITLTFSLGQSTPNNLHAGNGDTLLGGIIPIFDITVGPNNPPMETNKISDRTLTVGSPFIRDLNGAPSIFSDPDGDVLTYSAISKNTTVATASVAGSVLTVMPIRPDSTTITVTANDGKNRTASTSFTVLVYPSTLNLSRPFSFPNRSNASDYSSNDYRLIGLPGASDLPAKNLFSGEQDKDWQVVWDNGAPGNDPKKYFVNYSDGQNFLFSASRAFWIINKGDLNINLDNVRSVSLNANQEIEVPLLSKSGWNLITNPYTLPILWSRIQKHPENGNFSEPIYFHNGNGYDNPSDFEPYIRILFLQHAWPRQTENSLQRLFFRSSGLASR